MEAFSVAILAGGDSTRMGENKALKQLGDKPVIAHVIDALRPLAGDLFIVSGDVAAYEGFGLPVCADQYPQQASLVGIYSALAASRHLYCFVVACDMPFIEPALVCELAALAPGNDAVVPVSQRGWEPLHAVYSRDCLATLRRRIESGDYSVRGALDELSVKYVEPAGLAPVCDPNMIFLNVNTVVELEEASLLIPRLDKRREEFTLTGNGRQDGLPPGRPPLICFVGEKNSGKTTFLEKLIPALMRRGITVGCIKHDVHGFSMDQAGTDTWRLARAGARAVTISSPDGVASLESVPAERSLTELYAAFDAGVDLILVEGFKQAAADKIEVSRGHGRDGLVCPEDELVAVVSDEPGAAKSVPVFAMDDFEAVASLIAIRYGLGDGGAADAGIGRGAAGWPEPGS